MPAKQNFTQPLVVMVETFRMPVGLLSGQHPETIEISNQEITVKMEKHIRQYSKFGYSKFKDLCKRGHPKEFCRFVS